MPSFCKVELPLWTYHPIRHCKFLNEILLNQVLMLYTGDFVLRYYVRFLLIRSQN